MNYLMLVLMIGAGTVFGMWQQSKAAGVFVFLLLLIVEDWCGQRRRF